jgi:nitrogen fixation-related uncharacterized protein
MRRHPDVGWFDDAYNAKMKHLYDEIQRTKEHQPHEE